MQTTIFENLFSNFYYQYIDWHIENEYCFAPTISSNLPRNSEEARGSWNTLCTRTTSKSWHTGISIGFTFRQTGAAYGRDLRTNGRTSERTGEQANERQRYELLASRVERRD